jgi:hypothetical protein
MARQLASQRTAFAIAGAGPTQSDLFPVLEYAAPRAFYIGELSTILARYDERTRQQLLAPGSKTTSLRALSADDVATVFSRHSTMNGELLASLTNYDKPILPCVFKTNSPLALIPAIPGGLTTNKTEIFSRVTALLAGTPEQRRQAMALLESALTKDINAYPDDPSAVEWATLAAATAVNLGDLDLAQQWLALALKQNPADPQANYLTRILERERSSHLSNAASTTTPRSGAL